MPISNVLFISCSCSFFGSNLILKHEKRKEVKEEEEEITKCRKLKERGCSSHKQRHDRQCSPFANPYQGQPFNTSNIKNTMVQRQYPYHHKESSPWTKRPSPQCRAATTLITPPRGPWSKNSCSLNSAINTPNINNCSTRSGNSTHPHVPRDKRGHCPSHRRSQ